MEREAESRAAGEEQSTHAARALERAGQIQAPGVGAGDGVAVAGVQVSEEIPAIIKEERGAGEDPARAVPI